MEDETGNLRTDSELDIDIVCSIIYMIISIFNLYLFLVLDFNLCEYKKF